jgi:hypothetical protein
MHTTTISFILMTAPKKKDYKQQKSDDKPVDADCSTKGVLELSCQKK